LTVLVSIFTGHDKSRL